jgi:hypothetical protein
MSCAFNNHVVTNGTGIPVVNPPVGADCDCGEFVVTGVPAVPLQYSPTGRLMGR